MSIFWKKTQIWKIRHFWNEKTVENLFFYFQWSVYLISIKIWTPVLRFHFWLVSLWYKKWTFFENYYKLVIKWLFSQANLLNKCYDRFSSVIKFWSNERNTEARCKIYILIKKVIILRKIHVTMKSFVPPLFNYFSWSLNRKKYVVMIPMRKKLNIFTLQLPIYYILSQKILIVAPGKHLAGEAFLGNCPTISHTY